jgi:tetratricopeptide (TPR) repeat protein
VTILESPKPELYAYINGNLVITTGAIYAMENEAQLAGVLAPQVAQVLEGYYVQMYQEIKAAERKQRRKAIAGALLGALMDVAVDYAVEMETIKQTDRLFSGEATYKDTMQKMAAVGAAQAAYYSIKDVIASIPPKDESGQWVDPRLRFEPVADAQGLIYLALSGYEISEAAKGFDAVLQINSRLAREREQALGPWAAQMRDMQSLMELNLQRMRQTLGSNGLVQTLSDVPPSRIQFVAGLMNLKEVQEAIQGRALKNGRSEFTAFLKKVLLPKAEKALAEEKYDLAALHYQILYAKGLKSAPLIYGMAKSQLGDFAFGASEGEKEKAEGLYQEAIQLDSGYAMPFRGLGELYEDWERYQEAVNAYEKYLKLQPNAKDRGKIENKIKILKRKASR